MLWQKKSPIYWVTLLQPSHHPFPSLHGRIVLLLTALFHGSTQQVAFCLAAISLLWLLLISFLLCHRCSFVFRDGEGGGRAVLVCTHEEKGDSSSAVVAPVTVGVTGGDNGVDSWD